MRACILYMEGLKGSTTEYRDIKIALCEIIAIITKIYNKLSAHDAVPVIIDQAHMALWGPKDLTPGAGRVGILWIRTIVPEYLMVNGKWYYIFSVESYK